MEIEIKLAIAPRDAARLRRAAPLAGIEPRRERLDTIYFDTPDCELARNDLALRLRRVGSRWIEGLKSRQRGAGGLHVREEWEFERLDAGLELSRFADTPLAKVAGARSLHERLEPAFRVVMDRTTWRLSPKEGTRLEVALDQGEARAGRRAEEISEVEIECLEGDARAAFALAGKLMKEVRLRPSAISKAQRGYRLFRGEPPAPVKARPVALAAGDPIGAAARRVVAGALAQLQDNEEGVMRSGDPEFVHQARIALRRLRSALRMFRQPIGRERARRWRDALGRTARRLGEARDWDVFATGTLPPALAAGGDVRAARALRVRVARRRAAARTRARAALAGREHAATVLALSRWITTPAGASRGRKSLVKFATRLLRGRHRRVLRDLPRIASLDGEARHRLRIAAKRLRYGTEALASLFERARVEPYLEALSDLQDALGEANDAATAMRLVGALEAPPRIARRIRARLAEAAAGDPARLAILLGKLQALRPWR